MKKYLWCIDRIDQDGEYLDTSIFGDTLLMNAYYQRVNMQNQFTPPYLVGDIYTNRSKRKAILIEATRPRNTMCLTDLPYDKKNVWLFENCFSHIYAAAPASDNPESGQQIGESFYYADDEDEDKYNEYKIFKYIVEE